MFRHPACTLAILEESLVPLPRCPSCRMHLPLTSVCTHTSTALCRQGTLLRQKEALLETYRLAREVIFSVRDTPLESVSSFQYLGRPLSSFGDDWAALRKNLDKARSRWALISRVLAREGANPRVSAMFYKAAVQAVLLYSCETWSITSDMLAVLESFHHRVVRRLTRRHAYYLRHADLWVWPSITAALEECGMYTVREYISRRRQYLLSYSETRPLLASCHQAGRGSYPNQRFWWDKPFFS
jgi:L-rhamnose mutarotase